MDAYKVAVICSGHARMVPQGNHLHQHSFALSPQVSDWAVFSYCWTSDSEIRAPNAHQIQQFELRDTVLNNLEWRHVYKDQAPLFDRLCERFILEGALPDYRNMPVIHEQIRYHFGKYFGQLLGFCLGMDQWRDQLRGYDYIVRSRWDHTLDPEVLSGLDPEHFYTKSINIYNGRPIVGGDNVYGPTKKWMEIIPSTEHVIKTLITALKQVRKEIARHQPNYDFTENFQWFSTHYLWYLLFEYKNIHWLHRGESFGLNFDLAEIPLEKLTLTHAALGLDYYRSGPTPVYGRVYSQPPPETKDLTAIEQQKKLRRIQLEQQVQCTIEEDQVSPPKLLKN